MDSISRPLHGGGTVPATGSKLAVLTQFYSALHRFLDVSKLFWPYQPGIFFVPSSVKQHSKIGTSSAEDRQSGPNGREHIGAVRLDGGGLDKQSRRPRYAIEKHRDHARAAGCARAPAARDQPP